MDIQILKNYLYNASYRVLLIITPIITIPYISRVLSVQDIGIYNYYHSLVQYFILLGTLGLNMYGQREIAYVVSDVRSRSKLFWELLSVRCILSAISIGIYLILLFNSEQIYLQLILALEIIANTIDVTWVFNGIEQFKTITIRNVIIKLLGIICIFSFVKNEKDLLIYAIVNSLLLLIGNVSLWPCLKGVVQVRYWKDKKLAYHFLPVLITFLPQAIDSVYMIMDKSMLGWLSSYVEVGLYSQADRIIKILVTLITSIGLVFSPRMASNFANGEIELVRKNVKESFQFTFFLAFPAIAGVCATAEGMVGWFFGPGYEKVYSLICALSPIILLMGINSTIGWQYLIAVRQECRFMTTIVIGAIGNLLMNSFLIPDYGSKGAVYASVFTMGVMTLINFFWIHKIVTLRYIWKIMWKPLIISTIMYFILCLMDFLFNFQAILKTILMVAVGIGIYTFMSILAKSIPVNIKKKYPNKN